MVRRAAILLMAGLSSAAVDVEAPGVPNFHVVNEHVYRGGQPSARGWQSLAALGVKTVVDLRAEHAAANPEAQAVAAAGMRYVHVPLRRTGAPTNEQMRDALAALDSAGPVFVHCREGRDRTGTVIACYRIAHDGWSNAQALAEAKSRGLHWFEFGMKRYIQRFSAARSCRSPVFSKHLTLVSQHLAAASTFAPAFACYRQNRKLAGQQALH